MIGRADYKHSNSGQISSCYPLFDANKGNNNRITILKCVLSKRLRMNLFIIKSGLFHS